MKSNFIVESKTDMNMSLFFIIHSPFFKQVMISLHLVSLNWFHHETQTEIENNYDLFQLPLLVN